MSPQSGAFGLGFPPMLRPQHTHIQFNFICIALDHRSSLKAIHDSDTPLTLGPQRARKNSLKYQGRNLETPHLIISMSHSTPRTHAQKFVLILTMNQDKKNNSLISHSLIPGVKFMSNHLLFPIFPSAVGRTSSGSRSWPSTRWETG